MPRAKSSSRRSVSCWFQSCVQELATQERRAQGRQLEQVRAREGQGDPDAVNVDLGWAAYS